MECLPPLGKEVFGKHLLDMDQRTLARAVGPVLEGRKGNGIKRLGTHGFSPADGFGNLLGLALPNALLEVLTMINSPLEDIEAAALQLTQADRARLAERLLTSLDEDDEILAAWVEEAERRADAFDRGEMGAIDFDESLARLKAKLAAAA